MLLVAGSGCAPMHHRGGAVLTWQQHGGFGGLGAGMFGIGNPQLFEHYGVSLGLGGELGYDGRLGLSGALTPAEAHFYIGGAQPWAAHLMASFGLRFADAGSTSMGMQFGLNVGLSRLLYENERHLSLGTVDLLVRRTFAIGFRPDPMAAWIFGVGLFHDGFTCPECEKGIRGPDAAGNDPG